MVESRTVTIYLSEITKEEIEAINYLSLWCYTGYDRVDIYRDGKKDLISVYREIACPEKTYVIGAIWREDEKRFTFHS